MLIPQETFFEGLGCENLPNLSCDGCHKGPDGRFYHIDQSVCDWMRPQKTEAQANSFGDAYYFPDDWGDEEIIRQVRETMIKICNGEMWAGLDNSRRVFL